MRQYSKDDKEYMEYEGNEYEICGNSWGYWAALRDGLVAAGYETPEDAVLALNTVIVVFRIQAVDYVPISEKPADTTGQSSGAG